MTRAVDPEHGFPQFYPTRLRISDPVGGGQHDAGQAIGAAPSFTAFSIASRLSDMRHVGGATFSSEAVARGTTLAQ
jgi:hypothetical protein